MFAVDEICSKKCLSVSLTTFSSLGCQAGHFLYQREALKSHHAEIPKSAFGHDLSFKLENYLAWQAAENDIPVSCAI